VASVTNATSAAGATSAAEEAIVRAIEEQSWTDRVAEPVQRPLYALLERQGALRALLNGTWLGHPVHAAVTDLPVGAWASGFLLDLLDLLGVNAFGGRRNVRVASDAVQTIGLAGALGSALFGLADWSYTAGRPRRVGIVHGLLNVGIAGIYGASLAARARRQRRDLSRARLLLAMSHRFADDIAADYRIPRDRFRVVPHPIDLDRFRPGTARHADGRLTLLFVSRISAR
jgi:glycosyltransferase involved in cell wall biosynthesis